MSENPIHACHLCGTVKPPFELDPNGLCSPCAYDHVIKVKNHCKAVIAAGKVIAKTEGIETKLRKIAQAAWHCAALAPYAERGMETLTEDPREVLRHLEKLSREAVEKEVQERRWAAADGAARATTDEKRQRAYDRSVEALEKIRPLALDVTAIDTAIEGLRNSQGSGL